MSNVTLIRPTNGGGNSSDGAPAQKKRAPRKPKAGLLLFESHEFDGFTTQDVVNALHGVSVALSDLDIGTSGADLLSGLALAMKVLSSIVQQRVASPWEVRL